MIFAFAANCSRFSPIAYLVFPRTLKIENKSKRHFESHCVFVRVNQTKLKEMDEKAFLDNFGQDTLVFFQCNTLTIKMPFADWGARLKLGAFFNSKLRFGSAEERSLVKIVQTCEHLGVDGILLVGTRSASLC